MKEFIGLDIESFFDVLDEVSAKTGRVPVVLPQLFPNYEEAVTALLAQPVCSASRFVYVPARVSSEKLSDIEKKEEEVAAKIKEADSNAYFKNFKADNITCKVCNSHINKKYIGTYICPVCGNDMRPKSEFDRINGLNKTLENLKAKKDKEINNLIEKGTCIKYIVSGIE